MGDGTTKVPPVFQAWRAMCVRVLAWGKHGPSVPPRPRLPGSLPCLRTRNHIPGKPGPGGRLESPPRTRCPYGAFPQHLSNPHRPMIPIHELLSRIRWDQEFGRGRFEIGYYDRHRHVLQWVAFRDVVFPSGEGNVFEVTDDSGRVRRIPLHRVREVARDGKVIWHRPGQPSG